MPRTALIIGAGVAGPAVAVAAQRAGFDPVVFEAYERPADEVGAFLGLGLNGISALRTLGMDADVLARGFPTPRVVISNGRGRVLADFPNGGALPDGTRAITISRPDLYSALAVEADRRGIATHYGKRLVAVQQHDDGVRAVFADGGHADGDLLVGADGIRSATRRSIDAEAPAPNFLAILNTAGYARGLEHDLQPGVNHLVFGRRCFFGYVAAQDGAVWWFANPPHSTDPDPSAVAAVPAATWRTMLRELFADDRVPALKAIDNTEHIFAGWPTYDLPTVGAWHRGRVALVGDAAHAVSPSVGQGASLALEDAVVLGKCLRDVPDVARALATYVELRRDRVTRVAAQGRRNGSGKTAGPVGRVARDALMPWAMKAMFRGGRDPFRWIWDHHVDWDGPLRPVAARLPRAGVR